MSPIRWHCMIVILWCKYWVVIWTLWNISWITVRGNISLTTKTIFFFHISSSTSMVHVCLLAVLIRRWWSVPAGAGAAAHVISFYSCDFWRPCKVKINLPLVPRCSNWPKSQSRVDYLGDMRVTAPLDESRKKSVPPAFTTSVRWPNVLLRYFRVTGQVNMSIAGAWCSDVGWGHCCVGERGWGG